MTRRGRPERRLDRGRGVHGPLCPRRRAPLLYRGRGECQNAPAGGR
ncbi:MAG: hypothetical protein MZV64_18280 [Ignavibacteriales bacterium]|nr:hypothetical protein [Ignavibacteriales bacterium]